MLVMRVIVTGGTGFLGRPLVVRLRAAGHEVTTLTRRTSGQSAGREVVWHPDGAAGAWVGELEGTDAVINLAGEPLADRRWTAARKHLLRDSRLNATRSIVHAIGRARRRPPLLISASGVGYYGPRGSELVTESEPPGADFIATLARDWEAAATEAQRLDVRVVLLRTGMVLERGGGALPRLLTPFRLGVGGPLGSGSQFWPWIHRDDWIGMVEWLLGQPTISGPVNVTAPRPETNAAFSNALAATLRRPCLFRVPSVALRLALGEMADVVLTGQRAIPAKVTAQNFSFAFGRLDDALVSILQSE
jgi:uncharacterized protein (TIGR01777 family)